MKPIVLFICSILLTLPGCNSEDIDTAIAIADAIESDKDRDEMIEQLEDANERNRDNESDISENPGNTSNNEKESEATSTEKTNILNEVRRINSLINEDKQITTTLVFTNNTDSFGGRSFEKFYSSSCDVRGKLTDETIDNYSDKGSIRGSFLCASSAETGDSECINTERDNFQFDVIQNDIRTHALADLTKNKSFTIGSLSNPRSDSSSVSNGIAIILSSLSGCDDTYSGFQRRDDLAGSYVSELYSVESDGLINKINDLEFVCDTNRCSGEQIRINVVDEQSTDNNEGFFYIVDIQFPFGNFPGGILLTPETNDSLGAAWCDASQRSSAFKNSCFYLTATKQ